MSHSEIGLQPSLRHPLPYLSLNAFCLDVEIRPTIAGIYEHSGRQLRTLHYMEIIVSLDVAD